MSKRLPIPTELCILNPNLTIHEIRAIVNVVLKSKKNRLRNAYILDITIPNIGQLRSWKGKLPKSRKNVRKKDRKRNNAKNKLKSYTKEKLLF